MRRLPLVLALFLYPTLALAEHPVHDGKWEITSSTSFGGRGGAPGQVHTQCITKDNPVPKHESSHAKDCKVLEKKLTGSTVTWRMQCQSSHGPIEGTGHITYAHDTFDGSLVFTMTMPNGQSMEVTTTMSGKRLGECDGT